MVRPFRNIAGAEMLTVHLMNMTLHAVPYLL